MEADPTPLDWKASLARRLILLSQRTRYRGLGGYSPAAFAGRGDARPFPQAERESGLFRDFFALFPGVDVEAQLRGKDVLDFGSGYGGRTVEYARQSGARSVIGLEPLEGPIELSRRYAAFCGVDNVAFRVCGDTIIPLHEGSVDAVVSYDVLEHVRSPPDSFREIHRVLRRGGKAYLAFPVYTGATSHHLDYVTTLPGLHWLFSASTLVRAVNSILAQNPQYGVPQQPKPHWSFDAAREVLPQLNGLGGRHLGRLFAGFRVETLHRHALFGTRPAVRRVTGFLTGSFAPLTLRDAFTTSVACVLVKTSEDEPVRPPDRAR
jgi:SAM-dependent methyltransferase